jgi:hypothetical protein
MLLNSQNFEPNGIKGLWLQKPKEVLGISPIVSGVIDIYCGVYDYKEGVNQRVVKRSLGMGNIN